MDSINSPQTGSESSSKRKRERKAFLTVDSEIDMEFMELDIRMFCPKKIFDIIVINEVDNETQVKMNSIINTARKYEEISCVTFIKHSEVVALPDQLDYNIFPESVRGLIEQVLEETKIVLNASKQDRGMPAVKMAILMKIKLIEVMIRHYRRELEKMEKRKILMAELDNLTKDKGNGQSYKQEPHDRKKKSKIQLELEPLEPESDVIFDDDIYNHVWFYAFEGFYKTKVLSALLSSRVPITAIIKIDHPESYDYTLITESVYSMFWLDLDDCLFSHNRNEIFENTILMEFAIKDDDILSVIEDLLHAIKSISEIKFQHLNYIRHINVYQMDLVYNHLPLHYMHTYNKIMSHVPMELATEVVVLSSILEEACFQLGGQSIMNKYPDKDDLKSQKKCKSDCPSPLVAPSCPQIRTDSIDKKDPTTFQCYHRDHLSKILYMYKPSGKLVYDLSVNVLKCIYPFNLLDSMHYKEEKQTHKHCTDPASAKLQKETTEVFNHFINLFIFCTMRYTDDQQNHIQKFMENLCTYDNVAYFNKLRPKLEEKQVDVIAKPFFDYMYNVNPMDYYWKEKYPSFILMQELHRTQNLYAYADSTVCNETERLLVQFSDWLDEFGLNTKIFDENLLTPVCLRDFCRYTANEVAHWLKEHPPPKYVRKSEAVEICKGVRKLKRQAFFEEYRYLLEVDGAVDPSTMSLFQTQAAQNEVTFDEMMYELETYPPNTKLKEEYSKSRYRKDFTAYDFGTKYFALRGARTIFASHDNIKITVENSKFIDENDKCSVHLRYMDHTLVLHSNDCFKNFYSFHWILEDETIVVFEIQKKGRKMSKSVEYDTPENDGIKSNESEEKDKSHIDIGHIKVKNIHEEDLKTVIKKPIDKDEYTKDEDTKDIYRTLKGALEDHHPIYKVNKPYKTLEVIKPVNETPLVSILERVLQNSVEKNNESSDGDERRAKRFVPKGTQYKNLSVVDSAIFRVTLPNGIYVTCYPSQVKETLVEVKQEGLSKHITAIKSEEFRLYTREGYILIKYIDGSITILMSNGNKIDFQEPDTAREEIKASNLKPAHCKTVNDYRKKLNKLLKDSGECEHDYYISRRGALETKRGYINKDIIKILESSKLPYLRSSMLNFDGVRTVIKGNKISQKRLFYTISENDFCKEEIFYERKDGFKCILERSAAKTVEYPDGTRITTTVTVANELVDGYVYITLYYKYEHPHYATVAYCEGDLLQVVLNNVLIERNKDNICTLKLDEDATTTVDAENVKFEKVCRKCKKPFRCTFDISPFHNNFLDFSKQFVHAEDSYLKHLFVDYGGICRINKNYISGAFNVANCNHMELNTYKKLFAVKKTMSGEEFFTESMINGYQERKIDQGDYVEVVKKGKNHPVLKFKFNYYQHFTERLLTKSVLDTPVTLSKYHQAQQKILYYTTVKVICQITNAKKVQIMLSHLIDQFSVIDLDPDTKKLIEWLASKKDKEADMVRKESLERQDSIMAKELKICKCIKDKRTFARKILQWGEELKRIKKLLREDSIPQYFESEFCQVVNRRTPYR